MRVLTLYALALVLSGCATPQERAAAERREAQAYMASLQQRCAAYGFQPGTDVFAECIRREHLCAQEKRAYRSEYYSRMLDANRPGTTMLGAMGKAGRDTPRPLCQ